MASTMQKLESTANQASHRFYIYKNALKKKSPKYGDSDALILEWGLIWPPKICFDNEAPIWDCGVYMDILWGFYMDVMQVREWGEGALPRALE